MAFTAKVPIDAIKRYDLRGPRYTSYPSAASFNSAFGPADFLSGIQRSNDHVTPLDISLYLHIPFCKSLCYYCGCTKIVTQHAEKTRPYLDHLLAEAHTMANQLSHDRKITEIHLGGGTPTFIDPNHLEEFLDELSRIVPIERGSNRKWSIEIDPRSVETTDIEALAALGFTRMSFGVQDLDGLVQSAINRIQSTPHIQQLVLAAREAGVTSVNFDLIYGLPYQDPKRFAQTLDQVINIQPDRLAVYGYAHLPQRFHAQKLLDSNFLPDAETRLTLISTAIEQLTTSGYEYIGMDHFALPKDELAVARKEGLLIRNFQGYAVGPENDLLGLGMSAISSVDDVYAQNAKTLPNYYHAIETGGTATDRGYRLTQDDCMRRGIIQSIMCRDDVDLVSLTEHHGIDPQSYFSSELAALSSLEKNGLIQWVGQYRFHITPVGRLLLRIIAMTFDLHAQNTVTKTNGSGVHSRVI